MISNLPSMTTMLARFAEAARRRQVLGIDTFLPPHRIGMKPLKLGADWALQSLNFGHLDDIGRSDEAWDKTIWDETWKEGLEHILAGTFQLPFDECIYLFQYTETSEKYETVNLLHLVTAGDEIIGECYNWQPAAPGMMANWNKEPWQFTIVNGEGIERAFEPNVERQLPASVAAEYVENAKSSYTKVICATMLLGKGKEQGAPEEFVSGVNRGRALGKLAPLPDTVSVRFDQGALRQSYPSGGFTGSRQPHDRRGHYRTLPSGRVIPVKASKVHGGADAPRTYVVAGAV